jgi:hypothetical protein
MMNSRGGNRVSLPPWAFLFTPRLSSFEEPFPAAAVVLAES